MGIGFIHDITLIVCYHLLNSSEHPWTASWMGPVYSVVLLSR